MIIYLQKKNVPPLTPDMIDPNKAVMTWPFQIIYWMILRKSCWNASNEWGAKKYLSKDS